MSSHFWWYVARAGGLVAWGLVVASCAWGLLHALRTFGRRPSPSWMLSTHRYLSTLAIVFVALHVVAILADTYVQFSLADVLVPMVSSWPPGRGRLGRRRHVPARGGGGHVAGARPALPEALAGRAPAELRAPRTGHHPSPHRRHRRRRPPPDHVARAHRRGDGVRRRHAADLAQCPEGAADGTGARRERAGYRPVT